MYSIKHCTAEISWKHDKFQNVIIRMGTFHTICNLLSTIGERIQDAGMRNLFVESGVVADKSVSGVMEDRKYNRVVRSHELMDEALMMHGKNIFRSRSLQENI